jgi:hypothetical protein
MLRAAATAETPFKQSPDSYPDKRSYLFSMATENIVMLLVGIAFLVVGFLLMTKEKVAEWGLSHGRARIWVKMLGMERAKKLTKFFFGPVVMLFGIVAVIGSIATRHH